MWDASKSPGDLITSSDWNSMVTDQKGHATRHSDGGSDELDAADLAGASGTSGQVLQTDGTNTSWVTPSSETVKTISSDYTTSGETTILINSLSKGYNAENLTLINSFDVLSETQYPNGIDFNPDGSQFFIVASDVFQYNLSTAFDLTTASYSGNSYSVGSGTRDLRFNDDGTKLFAVEGSFGGEEIISHNLNTAYDITTASSTGNSLNTGNEASDTTGIDFNPDGTILFVLSANTHEVFQYNLSTAFDLTTASYSGNSFDLSSTLTGPHSVKFNDDGTKLFVGSRDDNTIYQYSLSTPYDVTSLSYTGNNSKIDEPMGIDFNSDGSKLFIGSTDSSAVKSYDSTTGTSSVTLSSSDTTSGKIIRVMDKNGNASSNNITVDTESSETINGETSAVLNSDWESLTFQSDGTDWFIVSRMGGGSVV